MKYCAKCGAPMNDDALFCSKCGAKFEEVVEQKQEEKPVANEQQVVQEQPSGKRVVKRAATPIYEQKIREFAPMSIAIVVCSMAMWILNATLHPSGITKVMPLLLFMLFCALYAVMSMVRAVKTLTRKMYLKSVLSFVFFGLLFVCFIINFVFLVS